MKRGGPTHPKFARLGAALGIPAAYAVGLMETLYEYTGNYAPRGDIGCLSDDEIARGAGFPGDPLTLIEAMVKEGLLDRSKRYRLVVHDWSAHANDWVHTVLARKYAVFIDGTIPKLSGIKGDDRPAVQRVYDKRRARNGPRTVHPESTVTEPSQAKPNQKTKDIGSEAQGAQGSETGEDLSAGGSARLAGPESDLGGLGLNPTIVEKLEHAGRTTREHALAVIADCEADKRAGKVKSAMDAAAGILLREVGLKPNGKQRPMGGAIDQARSALEGLKCGDQGALMRGNAELMKLRRARGVSG